MKWIQSFVSDQTQQVVYNSQLSCLQLVQFNVPQRSVLGPHWYILYTAEISYVVAHHGLQLHQYADDSQVYIRFPVSDVQTAVHCFSVCVHAINEWMKASRLWLNASKTQIMWLGSIHQLKQINISDIPIV